MGDTLIFKGFDTLGIGKKLDLPSEVELLRNPMFHRVSADDLYKHGGEINRWLLSQTPLKNSYKHVCISVDMKYLTPGLMPMQTDSWHCDGSGSPFYSNESFHIMIGHTDETTFFSETECTLEFNEDVHAMNHLSFREYIRNNEERINNLIPKQIPKNTIATFDSRHIHRAPTYPKASGFRFFWMVRESDNDQSLPLEEARMQQSTAWSKKDNKPIRNIEQIRNGIVLRNMSMEGM